MSFGRFLTGKKIEETHGISRAVLKAAADAGNGPPRVRLTDGKTSPWLYPEIPFNEWLESRYERKPEKTAAP
jgi:hypothetical protein